MAIGGCSCLAAGHQLKANRAVDPSAACCSIYLSPKKCGSKLVQVSLMPSIPFSERERLLDLKRGCASKRDGAKCCHQFRILGMYLFGATWKSAHALQRVKVSCAIGLNPSTVIHLYTCVWRNLRGSVGACGLLSV